MNRLAAVACRGTQRLLDRDLVVRLGTKERKDGICPVCHKRGIRDVNNGKVHGRILTLHATHTAKPIPYQLRTWKEITPQKDDVKVS